MEDFKCRGYAGDVPVYCAHDKIVPIGEVKPNPRNPNQHPEEQIELLAKIIKTQGWRAPVTVSTLSGLVVRGHGRLMAAQHLGLDCVPVDFQNYSCYDAELADLLADNKIAELAEIDSKMLAEVFQDINPDAIDMDITGYSEEEYNDIISALMDATAPAPGELDADESVEVQESAVSTLGDVWLLGKHRLMCGDSTNISEINKLLNGSNIDLVFTDPPYGNGQSGKYGRGQLGVRTILNDENLNCFNKFISIMPCDKIIYFLQWRTLADSLCKISEKGLKINTVGVWDKKNAGLNGAGGISEQWEAIVFAGDIKYKKFGGNVFNIAREQHKRSESLHPHMKPQELLKQIFDFVDGAKNILDAFGGSGSTLIACEKLGKCGYIMELDPHYVDVIVRRYIGVTGKTDVRLVRDGEEIPVEDTGIMN